MVVAGVELDAVRAAHTLVRQMGLRLEDPRAWPAMIVKIIGCGAGSCPRAP